MGVIVLKEIIDLISKKQEFIDNIPELSSSTISDIELLSFRYNSQTYGVNDDKLDKLINYYIHTATIPGDLLNLLNFFSESVFDDNTNFIVFFKVNTGINFERIMCKYCVKNIITESVNITFDELAALLYTSRNTQSNGHRHFEISQVLFAKKSFLVGNFRIYFNHYDASPYNHFRGDNLNAESRPVSEKFSNKKQVAKFFKNNEVCEVNNIDFSLI